ncbi:MAG: rhomboid family intramembrane serine protease [Clostridiales bacterium]|jgi:membrane associated rhomboid family serine protease|nr:rhomboid family intramembrane serine protease [Clostridiales bacterium]
MLNRIQNNAPVVIGFTLICLFSLLINFLTKGVSNFLVFSIYWTGLLDPLQYVRLFTHIFGHQDFSHFFNNIILILLLGPALEEKYGSKAIACLIAITAFTTGILNVVMTSSILLGASGIVFMFIILSSFVNLQKGKIPLTLILVVLIFIGQEIYAGISITDNVSNATHIAGGVCGAVLGYFINKKNNKL